ncbi:MAG: M56 family metallopeptidase, partial [Ruminococcus sp.]|nr:M56 family metallopeptidase [Ruminococcus sp.]
IQNTPVPENTYGIETKPIQSNKDISDTVKSEPFNIYGCLFFIWSALALVLFVRKITIYQSFIQYIKAGNVEVSDIKILNLLSDCEEKLNIKTRVELSYNPLIASPMMIGFFRPRIVLPVGEMEDKELSYIFVHELIHYKQRDMFYKWLIQIVVCTHWFNPFVYLLEKEVNKSCELSCDEKVISVLDDKARREYGDTLISFLKSNNTYKSSLASVTLTEGAEQLKERLGAIMNFKKKTKWVIFISLLLTVMLVCGFTVSGAYAANKHNQTKPNNGTDTVSLQTNSSEIIGFKQGEQTTTKEVAISITENDVKIQLNAVADGNSNRTLEVIDPDGEVIRTYTFNQDGFVAGNQEYLFGKDMIMVTDVVYPGTWYVRLSTNQTPAEKTSITAKLIDTFVWGFASDTDKSSVKILEHIADDSPLSAQMYDHYRTYEQTKNDIQNGYIVNTGASFSEQAMPTVIGGGGTRFYVNHDNSIDISITLKNLIDGTGRIWTPDSFVSFEVYDPSGDVAYSFYKEGTEIQNAVDIDTELAVYPGEWRYRISFAYTTNGIDTSDMKFALRYKTIFDDDIQWLLDNKLNNVN